MIYFLVILLLLVFELLYLRLASRKDSLIVPFWEETSNDQRDFITIRGGGIVFWFASLLLLIFIPNVFNTWFFAAITLIAVVSMVDDVKQVSVWVQLLFHIIAVSIAFYIAELYVVVTWWNLLFAYILYMGITYSFKLMDDVNGMTGLFSVAVLIPLMYVNQYIESFIHIDYLRFPVIAAFIFLVFNLRKRAATTAGTVGSMSIGFWVSFLLLMLIIESGSIVWLSFVLVYLVDVLLTTVQKIYQRRAFFGPEKLHFYQILGNELRIDHRFVSLFYFFLQLICSALVIVLYPSWGVSVFWILLIVLMGVYALKYRLVKVVKQMN